MKEYFERASFRTYFALFGVEIILLGVVWLPLNMSLDAFGFCDWGANLTLQYLVSHGYRPTIDFAYPYGLLTAFVGQLWFGAFGSTPVAYQAAMVVCDLLIVMALARIAAHLRFGPFGIAIMVVGMGYAVHTSYVSLAQALETVLICHALAAQTLGNKPKALMLSSAAVLAKPSMGYFYSFLLLILIALELRGRSTDRLRVWTRALAPTVFTFAGLLLVLAIDFGFLPLLHSVFPIAGMSNYKAQHFGFFAGTGRLFWYDPKQTWFYYFATVAGFWIFATLYLIGAALAALRKVLAHGLAELSARDELLITCALLHVAFVTVFFGNQWSWTYYSYLPVLGAAAAADIGPAYRRLAAALVMMGAISWITPTFFFRKQWATRTPSAATAGLWASPEQRDEWIRVLDLTHDRRAIVLDSRGAPELLFPQFGRPVTYFLLGGLTKPAEIQRKLAQLAHADCVVVPLGAPPCFGAPRVPQIEAALRDFVPLWKGKSFEVLQRRSDSTKPSADREHKVLRRRRSPAPASARAPQAPPGCGCDPAA